MKKVSKQQAIDAVKTLLEYIGEDHQRDGLLETPQRVVKMYDEMLSGYFLDPKKELEKTFSEVEGYDDMVLLKDVSFHSFCEHHMLPIIGRVYIGYIPNKTVVGISKLARIVEIYSKRLQIQERLTSQIANCIQEVLQPKGVGVVVNSQHHCMTIRGIKKQDSSMQTSIFTGAFLEDKALQARIFNSVS